MKKYPLTIKQLFFYSFLIAIFAISVKETIDPDMWWHLRTGEYILQEGIPRQDVFSFTVSDHEWITHEWLSQVIMWSVWRVGGFPGLMLFFAGINTLAFWLVYQRCQGHPYVAAFVLLLSAFASSIVWGSRPQMFNILLTAFFIYIIDGVRQKQLDRRRLWLLPIAMVVWANLHSGYLLGVVLLGTYAGGELIQHYWNGKATLEWAGIQQMIIVTLVCFLAAVLNPSGVDLWIYPFYTLGSNAMQVYIQEWHSPNFHIPIYWTFVGLLFLGVISWVISPKRPTWSDLLLFLGTGFAGLLSARHIPLFSLVAAPIVTRHLVNALRKKPKLVPYLGIKKQKEEPSNQKLNWALLSLIGLATLIWVSDIILNNNDLIAERYPVEALEFITLKGLNEQHIYNSYNWGGYLIWSGIPVFIDGRADVYGDDFLFAYQQAFALEPTWQEFLDQYDVDYVLMETGAPLTTLLRASPNWQEQYRDDVAQIFVRTPPEINDVIIP